MKQTVICDTNIWYYLGSGKLKLEEFEDKSLVATFYNFQELLTTPNILKDFQMVKSTAEAIVQYSDRQFFENAYLYLANYIDPFYEDRHYSYAKGLKDWADVKVMAGLSDSFELTSEMRIEYEKIINGRGDNGRQVARIDNDFVERVKAHSKTNWNKNNPKKYFAERFEGLLLELNQYLNLFSNNRVQLESSHLNNIELFLSAALQFARHTEIAGWVVKPNDAYDLFNLVYVRPGDLYLTKENRWRDLIEEAGVGHYLL